MTQAQIVDRYERVNTAWTDAAASLYHLEDLLVALELEVAAAMIRTFQSGMPTMHDLMSRKHQTKGAS